MAKSLDGRVAVVAGATRGAGRGIARMLGEAGATVYCTGRSSRLQPGLGTGRPETIEETADMVTAAGGKGIAVRVDHVDEEQVAALFDQVRRECDRLDVLANVATGQPASWKSFLDDEPAAGRRFVEGWIWPHSVTAWYGAKLMVQNRPRDSALGARAESLGRLPVSSAALRAATGLIVEIVEQDNVGYHGAFYFDMMEVLLKRLVFGIANDHGKSGVTAIAVTPGFMRTEAILEASGVTEATWRDALENPQAVAMGWGGSETPCFVGRAVAALSADPNVARKNGGIHTARALSTEYGFTDIDGRRPDHGVLDAAFEQAKQTFLAPMIEAGSFSAVDWKLVAKAET